MCHAEDLEMNIVAQQIQDDMSINRANGMQWEMSSVMMKSCVVMMIEFTTVCSLMGLLHNYINHACMHVHALCYI